MTIALLTVLCSLSDRVTRRSLGPNHYLEATTPLQPPIAPQGGKEGILESPDGRAQDSMPLSLGGKGTKSLDMQWTLCR